MKNHKRARMMKDTNKNVVRKSEKHSKEQKAIKRERIEAEARRKVAVEWERISHRRSYQKAATREACSSTTLSLVDELFDGIVLELNERNSKKSYGAQKRILRRIVEKRQAQSAHRCVRRAADGLARYLRRTSILIGMKQLQRHQCCA